MGLDIVDLMMEVEAQFGLKLSGSEYSKVRTVSDLVEIVMDRAPESDRRALLEAIRAMSARIAGMPVEQVHAESDLVQDLGLG
jgi:hypothetical protein